ncbi:MAG: ABC transporter permease [Anaerolineae bacterium]|nr:ABC transporter permease [Anaerolineae bacterium]
MQTSLTQTMIKSGSIQSLSRPTSGRVIVAATISKGLRIATRYLPNLVGNFVQIAIRVAFFMLLAHSVTFGSGGEAGQVLTGRELFIFFQGAMLIMMFNWPTLWAPINAVSTDLYNGTLEFLYSNPGSRYAYYVGTVVTEILISLVFFVPLYLFLALYTQASAANMLMVLLVCMLVGVTLTAMGIMIALLALLWRQVNSIANVLGVLFEFLAGAYLPVSVFPTVVQYLAYLLPYTWGYDLIRYYSFEGDWQTLQPVWLEWGFLVGYAVLYTVLSRYLLKKAEQKAKQSGLHII